jgi:hypothetical protein
LAEIKSNKPSLINKFGKNMIIQYTVAISINEIVSAGVHALVIKPYKK